MRKVVGLIVLLAVASTVWAGNGGEEVIVADGFLRFTGGYGPDAVEFLSDGDATIRFIKYDDAGDTSTYYMADGHSLFHLRDGFPRRKDLAGSRVDGAVFGLTTATEVLVSW